MQCKLTFAVILLEYPAKVTEQVAEPDGPPKS